jgi:hypothetical protein
MTFAHWKNILLSTGKLLNPAVSSAHTRSIDQIEEVEHFILDIPEGTPADYVVARLHRKLLTSGGHIAETDGLGFEEKWPSEVLRQFKANSDPNERWSWASLH